MKKLNKVLHTNLITVFVVINVVLYLALAFLPIKSKVFGDGDFHEEAKVISQVIYGKAPFSELSITKAPGPVLLYIIPYTIAGPDAADTKYLLFGIVWMAILILLASIVVYKKIAAKHGYAAANLFMLFTLIIPLHIYYSLGIMAEAMGYIGALSMLTGFLADNKKQKGFWFTLGLVFVILARPNTILVLPFIVAFALFYYFIKKDKTQIHYMRYAVYAGVLVILITFGIKSLPNTRATKKQEDYLALVMHIGRFQFRTETFDWRFWDNKTRPDSKDYRNYIQSQAELYQKADSLNQTVSKTFLEWNINDMLSHRLNTIKQFFVRVVFANTLQISSVPKGNYKIMGISGKLIYWVIIIIINLVNVLIYYFAIIWLFKKGNLKKYWPLYSLLLALWLFNGIVYIEQRYLFPSRAIIIFLAAMGLLSVLNKTKNREQRIA